MMHPAVRSTLVAIAMMASSVGTAPLTAQRASRAAKVDPCSLLSVADVKRITGKTNYDPADRGDPGDGIGGGDPCTYSHLGRGAADPAPPTVSVIAIAPNQRGRYFDWYKKQNARAGCTREPIPGLGLDAFAETCARAPELPVYLRGGTYDVVVGVEVKPVGSPAQAKAVAIALAKAAAPKIK
ncbi:MAG: hypothetical protein DMD35_19630 [Gemmatimonadetes bacterium]|nr:MAG: hypothetical protein DMD35_19630 [Gemmatimonadota bacterium]